MRNQSKQQQKKQPIIICRYINCQECTVLPPQQWSPCSTSNSDLSGQTSVSSTEEKKEGQFFFLDEHRYSLFFVKTGEDHLIR